MSQSIRRDVTVSCRVMVHRPGRGALPWQRSREHWARTHRDLDGGGVKGKVVAERTGDHRVSAGLREGECRATSLCVDRHDLGGNCPVVHP